MTVPRWKESSHLLASLVQKTFTDVVFARETALYQSEGIGKKKIDFTANTDVIKVLVDKGCSVLSALEDQCLAPGDRKFIDGRTTTISCSYFSRHNLETEVFCASGGTDEKFVGACVNKLKGNPSFVPAKLDANRAFNIKHTIGAIKYNAEGFLFKNKDVLRPEMVEVVQVRIILYCPVYAFTFQCAGALLLSLLIQASSNAVVRDLFQGVRVEKGKMAKGSLIGSQFLGQLDKLMALIGSTETHFIRFALRF